MPVRACKLLLATVLTVLTSTGVAAAQQPIQPLGPQLRLTQQGDDGDATLDVQDVDVAYNSVRNQFLMVWEEQDIGGETEIFGRILNSDGTPAATPFRISRTPDPDVTPPVPDADGFDSFDPAVAYDPERDRYGVVWSGDSVTDNEREIFLQVLSGGGALIDRETGAPVTTAAPAERVSNIGPIADTARAAQTPDIAYRPDVDGAGTTTGGDAWAIVYSGDDLVDDQTEIHTHRMPATAPDGPSDTRVSALAPDGDGFDPTVAVIPGGEDYAVAWEGSTTANFFTREIYAHRFITTGGFLAGQAQITTTGDATRGTASDPSITANPDASQLLVTFFGADAPNDEQVWVQRLNFTIGQIGSDQQVSSAGPLPTGFPVVGAPSALYHPGVRRYLITWFGTDPDRPGLSEDEHEVQGTTLDANGFEGAPQDFAISRMGIDNDEDLRPQSTSIALNTRSGRWLSVWASDDARGDLVDGELEGWGRLVGENFDVDGDGSNAPDDCDDGNPGIRPGAVDVFDNGVDEDCAGGDAQNPDRDGDGATRPGDCDDSNPAIRPGTAEVVNNEVDENCDRVFGRRVVDVDIEREFSVFARHTRVTKLRVKKLRPGMRIQLRCKGKKCPKKLRKGKVRRVNVTKSGTRSFTKLFEKARLRPKAVVDVRVFQPSAIARVDKFVMRKAKLPRRKRQCIPPGATRPRKSC
jgi:hypothetical protein